MEEPSNVLSHFLLSISDFCRAEGISAEGGKRKNLQMLHHTFTRDSRLPKGGMQKEIDGRSIFG